MSNQKSITSRSLAFWFGLALHLALGAALYHQVTNPSNAHTQPSQNTEHAVISAPTP